MVKLLVLGMAGVTVIEIAQLLGISKVRPLKAYEKDSINSSAKLRSGSSSSLSEMVRGTLNRIFRIDHKTTAGKIRAELNEHLKRLVSTKTTRWGLHKLGFSRINFAHTD